MLNWASHWVAQKKSALVYMEVVVAVYLQPRPVSHSSVVCLVILSTSLSAPLGVSTICFFLYTRRVWNSCMMWTKWKLNFISSMCWMLRALSLSLLLLLTIEWRWEKIISIINFLYAHFTPSCSNTLAAIVVRSPSCLSMMFSFCFAHV